LLFLSSDLCESCCIDTKLWFVIAGLGPAISLRTFQCPDKRDARDRARRAPAGGDPDEPAHDDKE